MMTFELINLYTGIRNGTVEIPSAAPALLACQGAATVSHRHELATACVC